MTDTDAGVLARLAYEATIGKGVTPAQRREAVDRAVTAYQATLHSVVSAHQDGVIEQAA